MRPVNSNYTTLFKAFIGFYFAGCVSQTLAQFNVTPAAPSALALNESDVSCELDLNAGSMERIIADETLGPTLVPSRLAVIDRPGFWFRNKVSGSSSTASFTLSNRGYDRVELVRIENLGNAFSRQFGLPVSVEPGESRTLNFRFQPIATSPDAQTADLVLHYSDGGSANLRLWGHKVDNQQSQTLTSCGELTEANTYYQLDQDVASANTCFIVKAENIVLDLNGHTVTYGSSGEDYDHGIVAAADYANFGNKGGIYSGGSSEGLLVMNGTIEQAGYTDGSSSPGEYGHGIYFNSQGNHNIEIANLTINVHGRSAQNIRSNFRDGVYLHDNILNSKVPEIENRHAFDGAQIHTTGSKILVVENNVLSNSIQAGIWTSADNVSIFENFIHTNSVNTNDFGIVAAGDYTDVYANTVDSTSGSGRGILVEEKFARIFDNDIDVMELPNNTEYNGCQPGGAFGIQLENSSENALVFENDVTAFADACDAVAIRLTSVPDTADDLVFNNRARAVKQGSGDGLATSVSIANVKGGVTFFKNQFVSNDAGVAFTWDGGFNVRFIQDSFSLDTVNATSDPFLIAYQNSFPASNNSFEDVVLDGYTWSHILTNIDGDGWHGTEHHVISRSFLVEVMDDLGNSVVPDTWKTGNQPEVNIPASKLLVSVPVEVHQNSVNASIAVSSTDNASYVELAKSSVTKTVALDRANTEFQKYRCTLTLNNES